MTLPPCGKVPALEALKDAKEAINAKLNLGKSALADLQTKLNAFKADVLAAIPKIPTLDSFQAELAGLIGASPTAIAAFLTKWQGKVEGLNELVAKVTGGISGIASLDFCKDVPNIKLDPVTEEVKTEPVESTPPTEAPAEVEPVTPTVEDKTEQPVKPAESSITPKIVDDYSLNYTTPYKDLISNPLNEIRLSYVSQRRTLEQSDEWKQVQQTADKKWNGTAYELLKRGQLTSEQAAVVKNHQKISNQINSTAKINQVCESFSKACENALVNKALGVSTGKPILNDDDTIDPDFKDQQAALVPGSSDYIEKIVSLVNSQKTTIVDYQKYRRSRFK